MRGEKIQNLTNCTKKFPEHCGNTFAEYFRETRNPPPFSKVPRRFKCPAPSTWLQHSLVKCFVMFYVLILDVFVRIILIRGSVWHVFIVGGEREGGSAGLSPQCSTYSHRRRYSRQHSWSDDALLPLFSLLFFTTAMPLPKKKTLERRQKIKERRQAMEEAKKAKAEQQMATQVLMMLQRWGLFNPVKAFTRSANAVLLFYNEPPIKNYS